jgi:hypothetical protein
VQLRTASAKPILFEFLHKLWCSISKKSKVGRNKQSEGKTHPFGETTMASFLLGGDPFLLVGVYAMKLVTVDVADVGVEGVQFAGPDEGT